MKKRNDEELDEFIDDEILDDETLDDEEDLLDDEILDDEDDFLDDEEEDDAPKKKGKKVKAGKKGKKKLSKGAIAGISIGSVAGVVAIVLVVILVILPMFSNQVVASEFQELLQVNGYQSYVDASKLTLRSDATEDHIVSVDEMIAATGYNYKTDKANFAAALYSLAITNYANVAGTGWYCYTDSSVYATTVSAKLGPIKANFETFNVGVRAAYGLGSQEADNPNADQAEAKQDNYFSQTISGVTVLDIKGITPAITDALKTSFGYNCQEFLYNGTYAYKRGPNGGASFYGKDDAEGYKYLMGAYNECFTSAKDSKYEANAKDPETGYPEWTFVVDTYSNEYSEAKSLDYIATPDNVVYEGEPAWGKLNTYYSFAYELTPYTDTYKYYCGTYGTGWAVYDFSAENIDEKETTIEYDSKNKVYTINMVVKSGKSNDACMFAKGSLTKDTKDYIQMQDPTYTLEKNMIQIYDNGLIKYWERVETVASEKPAKLTVLTGNCAGGGGTTNKTYMAFSYSAIDYSPLALAARYMPGVASAANLDLKKWPTIDTYDPKANDYTKLKA